MMIDTRDDVVVRLRPRPNLEVNRHFMCDVGRSDYRWMNRGDRLEAPLLRDGQRLVPGDWDLASARFADLVGAAHGPVVVLASGRASLESFGALRRLLEGKDVTAAIKVPLGGEAPLDGVPNLALRAERVPNLQGAELAGVSDPWPDAIARLDGAGLVVVLDADLDDGEASRLAGAEATVILHTVDDDRLKSAALLLPVTTMVEENGTYVNRDGRVQRFTQAKASPGMARPAWWVLGEAWARRSPGREAPATPAEAFADLSGLMPELDGLTYADLGWTGRVIRTAAPQPAGAPGAAR
jgi:NADH-quinone oxidoreductase subunit G